MNQQNTILSEIMSKDCINSVRYFGVDGHTTEINEEGSQKYRSLFSEDTDIMSLVKNEVAETIA